METTHTGLQTCHRVSKKARKMEQNQAEEGKKQNTKKKVGRKIYEK